MGVRSFHIKGIGARCLRVLLLALLTIHSSLGQEESDSPSPPVSGPSTVTLTLKSALAQALAVHPNLKEAIARVEANEFGIKIATAPRFPRLNLNAGSSISGTGGQPGGLSVVRTGVQTSFNYGVGLTQQLLDFGRTENRIKLSELQVAVTRLNYLLIRQNILDGVVQAYFGLLRQEQAIEVGRANVENAEALLNQAKGFLEAGTGAKIAVIQAEADLANTKFGLIQAQGAKKRARAALTAALGVEEMDDIELERTTLESPDWTEEIVRDLARKVRPDIVASTLQVALAEAQVRLAKSEYYPIISANAGFNFNDSTFPPRTSSYNLGVSLAVPVFNEPTLSATVGQAKANLRAQLEVFQALEIQVVQEATSALYSLREAEARADSAQKALLFATENHRLASERYEVGVGNTLEVSQAQRQLVEARTLEFQARFDVQNSVATLLRTTGQLNVEALLPPELVTEPVFTLPRVIAPPSNRTEDTPSETQP